MSTTRSRLREFRLSSPVSPIQIARQQYARDDVMARPRPSLMPLRACGLRPKAHPGHDCHFQHSSHAQMDGAAQKNMFTATWGMMVEEELRPSVEICAPAITPTLPEKLYSTAGATEKPDVATFSRVPV